MADKNCGRKAAMRDDSQELIDKCLNCTKERCVNCLDPRYEPPKGNNGCKPVIAFTEGGEEMRFDSAKCAGRFVYRSEQTIRNAIRSGRLSEGYYWRYA